MISPKKKINKTNKTVLNNKTNYQDKTYSLQLSKEKKGGISENCFFENALTCKKDQWMNDFTENQQKVIELEFNKMMKTLKKKLKSPQKSIGGLSNKNGNKTQRFQYDSQDILCEQTIRKNEITDRKTKSIKSPRNRQEKIKLEKEKIFSPKKQGRAESVGWLSLRAASPKRNREETVKSRVTSSALDKKARSTRKKVNMENDDEINYMLIGNNFVEVDKSETKVMESEIMMQETKYEKDSEIEFVWKEFVEEKNKLTRERTQSFEENFSQNNIKVLSEEKEEIDFHQENELNVQAIQSETLHVECVWDKDLAAEIQSDEMAKNIDEIIKLNPSGSRNQSPLSSRPQKQELGNESFKSESAVSICSPSKMNRIEEDPIKVRTEAIKLQINAQKEILNKLLEIGKITQREYEEHMDLAVEIYDKEMNEIENLKEMMALNEQKVEDLLRNAENSLKITSEISEESAHQVLLELFAPYKQLSSSESNKNLLKFSHSKEPHSFADPFETFSNATNSPIKSECSSENQENISPQKKKQIDNLTHGNVSINIENYLSDGKSTTKMLMEDRVDLQLGINGKLDEGVRTSVAAVFQFISTFFYFMKTYHSQEFLAYVNMPYGYSSAQRLKFMQGYDEDDEVTSEGIMYGLEEVIRPELLVVFHNDFYYKNSQNSQSHFRQYEKIHNKSIFDAINEAINKFRPYYDISGPPYPWTTSHKAMTYYLITEECIEELMEKVKLEVLKWSSSLCGLIVPEAVREVFGYDDKNLPIEQIFEKYTLETDCELLEQRENKAIKQEKIEINETTFQWNFDDEFKTAVLFEISSYLIEDLAGEVSEEIMRNKREIKNGMYGEEYEEE